MARSIHTIIVVVIIVIVRVGVELVGSTVVATIVAAVIPGVMIRIVFKSLGHDSTCRNGSGGCASCRHRSPRKRFHCGAHGKEASELELKERRVV